MTISQSYRLVEGDEVHIRAIVRHDAGLDDGTIFIMAADGKSAVIKRADANLAETVIRVGDEVRDRMSVPNCKIDIWPFGIVFAINSKKAWIDWPTGSSIEDLCDLQRVRTADQIAKYAERPDEHQTVELQPTDAGFAGAPF